MVKISDKLYCVKLTDFSGNPDLSFELLGGLESHISSYEDRETGAMYFTLYGESREERDEIVRRIEANLDNWREAGANFTAVHGVAKSRTRLSDFK